MRIFSAPTFTDCRTRSLYRLLRNLVFQSPEHVTKIEALDLPGEEYDDAEIGEIIRECKRLPECVYTATGVRMADSPMRRIAMKTHGAINHNAKRFYPVFDWVKADLLREFDASGVRLPVDYKLFGRTFDGIDYRFLKPIKGIISRGTTRRLSHGSRWQSWSYSGGANCNGILERRRS